MPTNAYRIVLTEQERQRLEKLIQTGTTTAHEQRAARVLLKADESQGQKPTDEEIGAMVEISRRTVIRIKKEYVQSGIQQALKPHYVKERPKQRKLDGIGEAQLTLMACGASPEGTNRWTLRLLADKMVELKYVDEISHETIRQVLKKMNSSPG